MATVNWRKLRKNIPNKVRAKARTHYDIFWTDEFSSDDKNGKKTYGITRFEPKQIVLNKNQGDKECVHTMWHEAIHAFSEEYEIGLTESQVVALEKTFPYVRELILTMEGKRRTRKKDNE